MSKTCQPQKVKWYEVLSSTTHKYLGESECVELRMGLYFELDGEKHSVTARLESVVDWDTSILDRDEVLRLVRLNDERGLLSLYNRTYGKNVCCPPKNFIETFNQISEQWK